MNTGQDYVHSIFDKQYIGLKMRLRSTHI